MKLSTFLSHFPEVVEESDGYVVPCPAHADSRPSLRVTVSDARKLLLRCRVGCSFNDVVKALDVPMSDLFNVEVDGETVRTTSSRNGPLPVGDIAGLAVYAGNCAERLQNDGDRAADALAYLERRFGVSKSLAKHLGLGVDPGGDAEGFKYLSHPYRRVPRLTVPFRDATGRAVGLQARDLSGTDTVRWCGLSNPEGAAWSKIAVFDLGTGLDVVLVTEGPGDGLTGAAAGYDAVAIRGAALAGSAEALDEVLPLLRDRRVVVCGDGDNAGSGFSARLGEKLHAAGLQVSILTPPDGDDLSSWRERDPQSFPDALAAAVRSAPLVGARPATHRTVEQREHEPQRTDLGNAERLYRHLDGLVRFAPEVGFYLWDGAVWVQDKFNAVRAAAHEVTRVMIREGAEMGGDEGAALKSWGLRSQESLRINSMLRELEVMPGVAVDVELMDARHDLLTFRNGVVDLRTGELSEHNPALLMTRKIDVDYAPQAPAPTWDYFLSSVFPNNPELVDYTRRLVGYGITGHTSEQCFAVLWGTGSNGKSVFTDTLTHVFRAITVTTPFSTFEAKPSGGIPNDLAALKGARLVMASEGEQGKPMAEAVIKRITGRDLISARFMRKEFFEFEPTFLIFLGTNYKPNFRGQDEGLWRRVKLVPWKRFFRPEERDHYLPEKLRAEAAGIAAWAVRGSVEWYRQGLGDPNVVVNATREYRETSDALAGFLPGRLVRDESAFISGSEAFLAYSEWAADEGLPERERWTRRAFYGAMEERGITRTRHASGQVLKGIRRARPGETDETTDGRAGALTPALVPGDQLKAPSLDDLETPK